MNAQRTRLRGRCSLEHACRWIFSGRCDKRRQESHVPSLSLLYRSLSGRADHGDAFEAIVRNRFAATSFNTKKPIPDGILEKILGLTQRAPSSFNGQPYAIVVVRSEDQRRQISSAMLGGNARKVLEAPVVTIFLADLEPSHRFDRVVELERANGMKESQLSQLPLILSLFAGEGSLANVFKRNLMSTMSPLRPMPTINSTESWSFKQTMLATQTYILAATSLGLATCPMEGFDGQRLQSLLQIPDRYSIPVVIATGYAAEGSIPKRSPRLPPEEVVFEGKFGNPLPGVPAM